MSGSCEYCGLVDGLSTCGACSGVKYCSRACQRAHWLTHKFACRAASTGTGLFAGAFDPPPPELPLKSVDGTLIPDVNWVPRYVKASHELTHNDKRFVHALLEAAKAGRLTAAHLDAAQKAASPGVVAAWATDGAGMSLLHHAAAACDAAAVSASALLDRGAAAAVDWWSLDTPTPVHVAAICGSVRCLRLLLAAGAPGNAALAQTRASRICVWRGCIDFTGGGGPQRVALPAERQQSLTGPAFWAPLHCAAFSANAAEAANCVAALLEAGAPVDPLGARYVNEFTPLNLAGVAGNLAAFEALLAAGADLAHYRGQYSAHAAISPVLFSGWANYKSAPSRFNDFNKHATLANFGGGLHVFRSDLPSPTPAQASAMILAAVNAGADPTDVPTPAPREPVAPGEEPRKARTPMKAPAAAATVLMRLSATGNKWTGPACLAAISARFAFIGTPDAGTAARRFYDQCAAQVAAEPPAPLF